MRWTTPPPTSGRMPRGLLSLLECEELLPGWYDDWVLYEREKLEQRKIRALETWRRRPTRVATGSPPWMRPRGRPPGAAPRRDAVDRDQVTPRSGGRRPEPCTSTASTGASSPGSSASSRRQELASLFDGIAPARRPRADVGTPPGSSASGGAHGCSESDSRSPSDEVAPASAIAAQKWVNAPARCRGRGRSRQTGPAVVLDCGPHHYVKTFTNSHDTRDSMTAAALTPGAERQAQVIVVGAGPGGRRDGVPPRPGRPRRAAAGEDGVPAREGLRRRAHPARGQAAASRMGIDTRRARLAAATRACASSAAGMRLELPWPDLAELPDYGLVRTRIDFDEHAGPARRRRPAPGCTSAPRSPARSSTSAPAASSA